MDEFLLYRIEKTTFGRHRLHDSFKKTLFDTWILLAPARFGPTRGGDLASNRK
ncbi:hypothetical protein HDF12_000152 [Edaphobacter lichenicola]|uniref:Uncharacterized protein n=1 Tax=Tunturiibacter lichenicola TaxID=2051959 RepID=A0A7Y9NIK6_9BACT|nr:hypothetical protein [Edaphobacter lichenicola]